jgi:hypothetical protein
MNSTYDPSTLRKTNEVKDPSWRSQYVTLIRVGADGSIGQAQRLAEKQSIVGRAEHGDCFLLVRRGRFQPDVLWVDNLAAAREALQAVRSVETTGTSRPARAGVRLAWASRLDPPRDNRRGVVRAL